jgi:hypothetical protein
VHELQLTVYNYLNTQPSYLKTNTTENASHSNLVRRRPVTMVTVKHMTVTYPSSPWNFTYGGNKGGRNSLGLEPSKRKNLPRSLQGELHLGKHFLWGSLVGRSVFVCSVWFSQ